MTDISRADICAVACADLFDGAGEIMASPMGVMPSIGARLAKQTGEPDLLLSDGEAYLMADTPALGETPSIEGWIPYRKVFDVVASGRRHVVMGANQIDRFGNQNISHFGPHERPSRQMFGSRGAPGNTINHRTSYWIPRHSTRVFTASVDFVSGIGYDRVTDNPAFRYFDLHRIVSNLGVFDFGGGDLGGSEGGGSEGGGDLGGHAHVMRLVSVHPGVTVDEVVENTGFELNLHGITDSRLPTDDELALLGAIDPRGLRHREVPS